jgi:hypothetical protein
MIPDRPYPGTYGAKPLAFLHPITLGAEPGLADIGKA